MAKNISSRPGIYLHIPFCDKKCGYCDFYSVTDRTSQHRFIAALKKEIEQAAAAQTTISEFDTIYLGGGTPSLLETGELEELFKALYKFFNFSSNVEITLETNPGTINLEKLKAFRAAGVNRLSIGIQSFIDEELKVLDRIHSSRQAIQAIEDSRRVGFDNIGIDLIFALPEQRLDQWIFNLKTGLSFLPEHISAYNLIFEEGTPFHQKMLKGQLAPQKEKKELEFFKITIETLRDSGYLPYEVSNYARNENYYSRHNSKYWDHTNYLGFGPSAHSLWNNKRWANKRSLGDYLQNIESNQAPVVSEEVLDVDTREFEFILLGLRTYAGLNLDVYQKQFGQSFSEKYKAITGQLLTAGLAVKNDQQFFLTQNGMYICDEIIQQFISS